MFGNIFNRTLFGEPNTNWSSPSFGQVFSQANSPRSIQLALRYDF
jgi:prolipoprotein diacylglyceryltransferase